MTSVPFKGMISGNQESVIWHSYLNGTKKQLGPGVFCDVLSMMAGKCYRTKWTCNRVVVSLVQPRSCCQIVPWWTELNSGPVALV